MLLVQNLGSRSDRLHVPFCIICILGHFSLYTRQQTLPLLFRKSYVIWQWYVESCHDRCHVGFCSIGLLYGTDIRTAVTVGIFDVLA